MNNKKLIVGIVGGVLLAIIIATVVTIMVVTSPTTIDLKSYIECTFEGYDHMGEADVIIDFNKVAEDYTKELDIKGANELSSALITMNECVVVKVDKYTGYTNNDEFIVKLDIDNTLMKERYNCELECEDIICVVSNLVELTTYNPFDDMSIEYSGNIEYEATAKVSCRGEYGNIIEKSIGYGTGTWKEVYNGQEIKIKLSKDQEWFAEQGLYVTEFEKTYIVDGLDTYRNIKVSDIDAEHIEANKKEVTQKIMSQMEKVTGVEYIGAMVEQKGPEARYYTKFDNRISLVYKVSVTDETGDWTYYYRTTYTNVVKKYNGKLDISSVKCEFLTASMGWFGVNGTGFEKNDLVYAGYKTLEEIYDGNYEVGEYELSDVTIK